LFEDIDFGEGVNEKYIDFNVNKDISLDKQIDWLKEDLVQVSYDNNYLIDIGWYHEFIEEGFYINNHGKFDKHLYGVICDFQRKNKLRATGEITEETWNKLFNVSKVIEKKNSNQEDK
jgi:peptidoglycan hydrolase-like protein with peptidoglycan-binding domain